MGRLPQKWLAAVGRIPGPVFDAGTSEARGWLEVKAYLGDKVLGLAMKRRQLRGRPEPADLGRLTSAYCVACSNKLLADHIADLVPQAQVQPRPRSTTSSSKFHRRLCGTVVEVAVATVARAGDGEVAIDDLARWLLDRVEAVEYLEPKGALLDRGGTLRAAPLADSPLHAPVYEAVATLRTAQRAARASTIVDAEKAAAIAVMRHVDGLNSNEGGDGDEGTTESDEPCDDEVVEDGPSSSSSSEEEEERGGPVVAAPWGGSWTVRGGDSDKGWVRLEPSKDRSADDRQSTALAWATAGEGEGAFDRLSVAHGLEHVRFVDVWLKKDPPTVLVALAARDQATNERRETSILRSGRDEVTAAREAALEANAFIDAAAAAASIYHMRRGDGDED